MAGGAGNGDVGHFRTGTGGAKHDAATAHVTASDKLGWEYEAFSEDFDERGDVFLGGDATEEDVKTLRSGLFIQKLGVSPEELRESWILDGSCGDGTQLFVADGGVGVKQSMPRSDDNGARRGGGW